MIAVKPSDHIRGMNPSFEWKMGSSCWKRHLAGNGSGRLTMNRIDAAEAEISELYRALARNVLAVSNRCLA
ncbi:hypothetical protein [Paenibacillus ginsengihumi]|uniref:hypothetical protein n=1 Tax=Paenibacillus ginsengihumi TaxID=431596 RepID=UPI0003684DD1|nr:hypothetical protein [Paenibacillus ginsengihumi]